MRLLINWRPLQSIVAATPTIVAVAPIIVAAATIIATTAAIATAAIRQKSKAGIQI